MLPAGRNKQKAPSGRSEGAVIVSAPLSHGSRLAPGWHWHPPYGWLPERSTSQISRVRLHTRVKVDSTVVLPYPILMRIWTTCCMFVVTFGLAGMTNRIVVRLVGPREAVP